MTKWTYERRFAARLGDEIVTIPDQIADDQRRHNTAETAFPAQRGDGRTVRVHLDGEAYGLHTVGTGDCRVRRVNHPNRNRTFRPGARVEGGSGDDRDMGVVVRPEGADAEHPLAKTGRHALVAWQSGVRTWTPVSDLRRG